MHSCIGNIASPWSGHACCFLNKTQPSHSPHNNNTTMTFQHCSHHLLNAWFRHCFCSSSTWPSNSCFSSTAVMFLAALTALSTTRFWQHSCPETHFLSFQHDDLAPAGPTRACFMPMGGACLQHLLHTWLVLNSSTCITNTLSFLAAYSRCMKSKKETTGAACFRLMAEPQPALALPSPTTNTLGLGNGRMVHGRADNHLPCTVVCPSV